MAQGIISSTSQRCRRRGRGIGLRAEGERLRRSVRAVLAHHRRVILEPDVRGDDEDGVDRAWRTALRRHGSRGRPYYDLVFDGQELALRENGEAIADWPAVSGRPGMQDGKYQSYRDHGPLPQGRYQFSVGQLQRYDDLSLMQRAIAPLGLGKWRGGTAAWGRHRFWLTPKAGTEAF